MRRTLVFTGMIATLLVLSISACSSIEIRKPSGNQKFLVSPNNLMVVHRGCGSVRQNTFRAWLNKGEPNEQEITDFFSYANETWVSSMIPLPQARSFFTAHADVTTSGFCYKRQSTDRQEMFVVQLPKPLKIMPLGDSITRGCCLTDMNCDLGYDLSIKLAQEGYDVEIVGSQEHPNSLCSDPNTPTSFDRNHEGHYGKSTEWLKNNVSGFLQQNSPDVVLLHIGTNDLRGASPDDIPDIVSHLRATLETIHSFSVNNSKDIVIFVALIINQKPANSLVSEYNAALAEMVRGRIEQGYPTILVNMETGAGLDYQSDISDNFQPFQLHPNAAGYTKMADLWYRTLVSVLGPP